jgi:hypothetical protein
MIVENYPPGLGLQEVKAGAGSVKRRKSGGWLRKPGGLNTGISEIN